MRYPASEKLEIIRLVEGSHLSARLTLAKLGIPRTTFYRWYDRYLQRGEAGLQDQSPKPKHVWNRIPDEVRRRVVDLALEETELSPRELAVTFTDNESYFVSEASVYRVLKAHDLITSPAFIVIKAASEFKDKTTAINQLTLSSPQAATAGQRADRLYLPQGSGLGLVLSQHDPGRLQPLHHLMEALYKHEDPRRH
jgi:putative transposase